MFDYVPACCERFLLTFSSAPLAPNAALQARGAAGATQERRLFPVACKRLFGMALTTIVVPLFSEPRLTTPSVSAKFFQDFLHGVNAQLS
jgi:hypothetical protein